MDRFKKDVLNMPLSDKIKVHNALKGHIYSSKGYVCGLKDNKVSVINLRSLHTFSVEIDEWEELFEEMVAKMSLVLLKRTVKVLFFEEPFNLNLID